MFHLRFTGEETREVTVTLDDGRLVVEEGCRGAADVRVRTDSRFWLAFLAKDVGLARGLLAGKLRVSGKIWRMKLFERSFPL